MNLELWLLVAILVVAVLTLFSRGGRSDATRLPSIDRKLDLILTNLGIDPDQGFDEQLVDLVKSGRKIEAIKLYRAQAGVGLKEAKEYVERL